VRVAQAINLAEDWAREPQGSVRFMTTSKSKRRWRITAAGYPRWREIECAERGQGTTTKANNLHFTPDSGSDRYALVLETSPAWSGTCMRLLLKLNDGTQRSADFKFTK